MSREDRMARAGDYVLGLMDERERARAERDMTLDAEFRDCVRLLSERIASLRPGSAEQAGESDHSWQAIASRIAAMPQMARDDALRDRIEPALPGPDPTRKGMLGLRRPFAAEFQGLRGSLIALCLVAAAGFGFLVGAATAPAAMPVAVAILADEGGEAGALLERFADDRIRILPLRALDMPEGKVMQLWTVAADAPLSLGIVGERGETVLPSSDLPPAQPGRVYRITLEDAPGSPTQTPLGPVLVSGSAVHPPR